MALACCVGLVHDYASENAGISYYPVHHRTIALAIIGYIAGAIGLWLASSIFREGGLGALVWVGTRAVAVMLVLLLLTPYTGGPFLNWAHMAVGVVGALVQLAISFTLLRRQWSRGAAVGFAVQLLGGVLGALSLPDWSFQLLLPAEIMIELGFGYCLLAWANVLEPATTFDSIEGRQRGQ